MGEDRRRRRPRESFPEKRVPFCTVLNAHAGGCEREDSEGTFVLWKEREGGGGGKGGGGTHDRAIKGEEGEGESLPSCH